MSRKKRIGSRSIKADAKYGEHSIAKLTNVLMQDGKRAIAERAVYTALDDVQQKLNDDPIKIFQKALMNVKPLLEVRSRRVGGANYQVPTEVPAPRAQSLALRWLVAATEERGEKTLAQRLSGEIMDAFNNRGGAVKKREDTHRMAEANKAFAHFRW
ncbi:MAG: 30S ribosomal protein S7 [Bdellovibrionota bacterium]|nr:MAG: 30S ribosomal protein S7 [Bdellovibrionota bacterium]